MSSLKVQRRVAADARGVRALFAATIFAALLQCGLAPDGRGQATQQRVYGAASATTTTAILPAYNKDSSTGGLSLLPGAPFADRLEGGLLAIDGQGRFLFVLNPVSDSISMFQIDSSTGALTEVPGSPFAAGPTVNPSLAPSDPISLATEVSGNFLYVGYANGDSSTTSALVPFAIDAADLQLVLTAQQSLDLGNGAPVQMMADPKGFHLYVGLGPAGSQGSSSAGTLVYSIDTTNGILTQTGNAGGGNEFGRAIAMDPQGKFFFDGWGQSDGFLDYGLISPVDGTSNVSGTLELGPGTLPSALLVDGSAKFLYAQTGAGLLIFSIDATSGALAQVDGPLGAFLFAKGKVAADPAGPFVYSLGSAGVDVFQIDATTGNLTEIPGAPFSTGASGAAGSLGLAIAGTAIQSVSGPAAQVFPGAQDFGQIVDGQTSATKILSVANVGGQTLGISGITVTGANAGDFAESSTCGATLAVNANCSISILFTPSLAGAEQATLQVSDNAPGSPQAAALTGTGVAARGSVTLAPASVNFGSIAQGTTTSQNVTVTNSGSSVLHISGAAFSGSNPGDFSEANTCVGNAVAVQGNCTITVSFAPQTQGQRTASLVITDDGAGSPQTLALSGSGAAAFQLSAVAGATSMTVTAGQTAQYALQVAPGPGFNGSVAVSCSGAPAAATCSVTPASLPLTGGVAAGFQVSVVTTASGTVTPGPARRWPWEWILVLAWSLCAWSLCGWILVWFARTCRGRRKIRLGAWRGALGVMLLTAGCGGGSASPTANVTDPPPQVHAGTPQGTSTLTITAQSGTLPAQSLQLTLTVN